MFLDNNQLLQELKAAVLEERKITLKVLQLLKQVEARRLFAEQGFDSLFTFTVKFLGYSEPAAGRRISAMRLLKELPEMEAKVIAGTLNLTNLVRAQSHFRYKDETEPLLREEKLELLRTLENKSTRECEKIILAVAPESIPQERRRELTATYTEIKTPLREELIGKLDRLKKQWSHKNPNMTDAELIELMADFCLGKIDPLLKPEPKQSLSAPRVKRSPDISHRMPETVAGKQLTVDRSPLRTRYVPAKTKNKVWRRDNGKCQFVNKETGEACESQRLIQIDHKYPYSFGGGHDPENLQLLCATHNRLRASDLFSWKPSERRN